MARVLGEPQYPRKLIWGLAGLAGLAAGLAVFLWPSAPDDDQLARVTILSACEARTPGQAWLEARSAAGADGAHLSSGQRRAAMDYLLASHVSGSCDAAKRQDDDRKALAFSKGD